MAAELSEAARTRGVSRSALIREVLATHLRAGKATQADSALSRALDLVGAFPGPNDLSVNPDYRRGFGR